MRISKEKLKEIIKEEISYILNETERDIPYSDLATMYGGRSKKGALEDMKSRIADSQAERGFVPSPTGVPSAEGTRDPWDGIEGNAEMIGDNALKIEYLARALNIEIPIDLKYPQGPKG
jgi:hypothetical protein